MLYEGFSALSFSLYTVLSQKYTKRFGGIIQTSIVLLTGSIILLIGLLVLKINITVPISLNTLISLIYLGVLVTVVGYALYFKVIEKGGAVVNRTSKNGQ